MKRIPLTQGQIALVDDEDYNYLNQFKWYFHFDKRNGRCSARRNKKNIGGKTKTVEMGREILGLTDSETEARYRDGNALNNCRKNLAIFQEV